MAVWIEGWGSGLFFTGDRVSGLQRDNLVALVEYFYIPFDHALRHLVVTFVFFVFPHASQFHLQRVARVNVGCTSGGCPGRSWPAQVLFGSTNNPAAAEMTKISVRDAPLEDGSFQRGLVGMGIEEVAADVAKFTTSASVTGTLVRDQVSPMAKVLQHLRNGWIRSSVIAARGDKHSGCARAWSMGNPASRALHIMVYAADAAHFFASTGATGAAVYEVRSGEPCPVGGNAHSRLTIIIRPCMLALRVRVFGKTVVVRKDGPDQAAFTHAGKFSRFCRHWHTASAC